MLLVKNTAWARQFFKDVVRVFKRPKVAILRLVVEECLGISHHLATDVPRRHCTCCAQVMRTFLTRDEHLHGPRNATMDQVMMYMLLKDKGVNQPKVCQAEQLVCVMPSPCQACTHHSRGHMGTVKHCCHLVAGAL